MPDKNVDVVISVCGKPYQTALALLSLERACGERIDRIYFIEENTRHADIDAQTGCHGFVLDRLAHKIDYFMPEQWNHCFPPDLDRMDDEACRLSVRYQYG